MQKTHGITARYNANTNALQDLPSLVGQYCLVILVLRICCVVKI